MGLTRFDETVLSHEQKNSQESEVIANSLSTCKECIEKKDDLRSPKNCRLTTELSTINGRVTRIDEMLWMPNDWRMSLAEWKRKMKKSLLLAEEQKSLFVPIMTKMPM